MPGCSSPSHMRGVLKRAAAGLIIPEGAGLSGAGGSPRAQPRLSLKPGGGVSGACALANGWLLGNRVREEPILYCKGAGTHNDGCPQRTPATGN